MASIYIEQLYGISGDMINAALLNMDYAGGKNNAFELLMERLSLLELEGYRIEYKLEKRNHLTGGRFIVHTNDKHQIPRSFQDIKDLILNSELSQDEKNLSISIFQKIAEAESKVHGTNIEKVHFHEVGAVDSIIDIVGFSILSTALKVEKYYSSPFKIGRGKTISQHGEIPVPAPATVEILKGFPVIGTEENNELTTPTGAAIATTVSSYFGPMPHSVIKNVGIGYGSRKDKINMLRLYLIEKIEDSITYNDDLLAVIETTIDDSTPEEIAFLQERLLKTEALDVFITPIIMKKNRPGFNITVIANPGGIHDLIDVIFKNSSTFGIRYGFYLRKSLKRKIIDIKSKFGTIPVKIGYYNDGQIKISPEYDVCSRISKEKEVPLRDIFEEAKIKAKEKLEADQ